MPYGHVQDEHARYQAVAGRLSAHAARAAPILCGFSACVDVYLDLARVLPALMQAPDDRGRALGAELARRAHAGIGGEICWDWPDGPAFLDRFGDGAFAIGGTSAQAANMLAMLGAPACLALEDRCPRQLSVLHPDITLVEGNRFVAVAHAQPAGIGKPAHYIFEFTAGEAVDGKTLSRSSRVILRFAHEALEQDAAFNGRSGDMARSAGAAILCGFNGVPDDDLARSLDWAGNLASQWQRAGVPVVHLEFADFPNPDQRWPVLHSLQGTITSLGMSLNELNNTLPGPDAPDAKARQLAARLDLRRMNVHGDYWAFSITRDDPERELEALHTGCLLAAARAAAGRMTVPAAAPPDARFASPPWPALTPDLPWHRVACPAPHLATPRSTIGLGDTFLAGCLLVLAGARAVSSTSNPSST